MRIRSLYIKNVQAAKEPVMLEFDKHITRIDGPNAAGKSLIVKSFTLFSGTYSKDDIKGLVPKHLRGRAGISKEEYPIVGLLLENKHSLWATIDHKDKVTYAYKDENDNNLKIWEGHSTEILDILGWKVVENEDLILNIKKSKENLFIDSKSTTNSEIVEYICRDLEMEIRLANLEEHEKELNTMKKSITSHLDYHQKKTGNMEPLDIEQLRLFYEALNRSVYLEDSFSYIKNNLMSLCKAKEITESNLKELRKIKLLLSNINLYTKQTQMTRDIKVNSSIKFTKEKIVNIGQVKEGIKLKSLKSDNLKNNELLIGIRQPISTTRSLTKAINLKNLNITRKDYMSWDESKTTASKNIDILNTVNDINITIDKIVKIKEICKNKTMENKLNSVDIANIKNNLASAEQTSHLIGLRRTNLSSESAANSILKTKTYIRKSEEVLDVNKIKGYKLDSMVLGKIKPSLGLETINNKLKTDLTDLIRTKHEHIKIKQVTSLIRTCPTCKKQL